MVKDELGNKYGKLTVIAQHESISDKAAWECKCECGNLKIVTGDSLRQGKVRSCGCFQSEWRKSGNGARTHGHGSAKKGVSRTYKTWQEMRARCSNQTHISYPNYGGRGIQVCKRWEKFENFLLDMGERPLGTSIDRINNNGDYTPKNCKWATRKEQNNKRRQCRYVTYMGLTLTISQWCDKLKLPYPRTYFRLVKKNMSPKEAFETNPHRNSR